jgi:UDP-N-acetyl-D-mannosaminuronic acid dehydrogenase
MKNYDVCIIGGAGRVGLPLSLALADKNKKVLIHDINETALRIINQGKMPFKETGAEAVLQKVINKSLITTSDFNLIKEAKFVIVIIGTPVDEHLNPKFNSMKNFFIDLTPHLHEDQIIVLRSTVYPGSSEKIRTILKNKLPNIEVCFCPERIAEGKAMEELFSLPQIVSGFDETAIRETGDLFKCLTKTILIVRPLEAELAKLFTNSWRYIQFATANEFYMIAEEYGADFFNIYNAMTHDYPRTKGFPKPGFAAGPCLFKDTMQISAFTNNNYFLGHSAMLVNEGLPNFMVTQLKKKYPIHAKNVGILGMAFKAESDDIRESLSYKLKKILEIESKEVVCTDPYVVDPAFLPVEDVIDKSDIIIIAAPHKNYADLDYKGKVVIDIWNLIQRHSGENR